MLYRHLHLIAALALAVALPAAADKIKEAHDTPPENQPESTGDRGAAKGVPKEKAPAKSRAPAGAGASTRGENIDEAHRTTPPNTPGRFDGKR